MIFDSSAYTCETLEYAGGAVSFRAYRNVPYCERPLAPELQVMNIFIPQAYIDGGEINGYTARTAPMFFPNAIGGFMEALPCSPEADGEGRPNTAAAALARGYVVASAGARGRTTSDGKCFIGKAPAAAADLKAAVRFLRWIAPQICGDAEKIISNGTSAGGAMSALLGASGDASEFLPYLEEMGAVQGSDRIFAASCYCPITDLEHADTAYEWQYGHLDVRHWHNWRETDGVWRAEPACERLSAEQMALSARLAAQYGAYLNSVTPGDLTLDSDGGGSFADFICREILRSAQTAADSGEQIPPESGISLADRTVNLKQYSGYITRMKPPGAFDAPDMSTWENQLFGTGTADRRHFSAAGMNEDTAGGDCAPAETVRLMNAMEFLGGSGCVHHWRIRHGAADRDTSFAVSALLAARLASRGCSVDYFLPWGVPHSGDYDLDRLFGWIDDICR